MWVLDSSSLIRTKEIVTVSNQWAAFKHLEEMVKAGQIAMPRQVINEMSEIAHPDLPGAWAPGMRSDLQHPLDADFADLGHVMQIAGDVVDVNKTTEDADPYVLALAYGLKRQGNAACIVTEDTVDRNRISIATACDRLNLDWVGVRDFLAHCNITTKKEAVLQEEAPPSDAE